MKYYIVVYNQKAEPEETVFGVFDTEKEAYTWFDLYYEDTGCTCELYRIEMVRWPKQ